MQSVIDRSARRARALKIIRAAHLGMCFGVRDAIALALRAIPPPPLTILGDLAHNESVRGGTCARAASRIENHAEAVETPAVMITAHGASDKALHGRAIAVCACWKPPVRWSITPIAPSRQLVREGFHPVIIGQRGHVEVRGLTGGFGRSSTWC